MTEIKYVIGDATEPVGDGKKIICHVCNDIGGWGRGFVLALSNKWKEPEAEYRRWSKKSASMCATGKDRFKLGNVQFVNAERNIVVANMIGQHDIKTVDGTPPIRYEAIDECLKEVEIVAKKYNASVHACRFGAGLAGGDWNKIEELIIKNLCENDVEVTVYDLK